MIDATSFAAWYLIEELASNQGSDFTSSCMLYKTKDWGTPDVLTMGPPWDFDIAFGNTVNIPHDPNKFFTRTPFAVWFVRMVEDANFTNKVKQVWQELKTKTGADGSGLATYIDTITGQVAASMTKDQVR